MKYKLIPFLLFNICILLSVVSGQNRTATRPYQTKIFCSNGKKFSGRLIEFTDSSIIITTGHSKRDTIYYTNINTIVIHNKNSSAIGLAIGGGIPLVLGIAIALTAEDPAFLFVGFIYAIPLGLIGALIGSTFTKTYIVYNSFNHFQLLKNYLVNKNYLE
jgi:hypothetical protein